MAHVMASFGIDHAFVTCPHYKRELRTWLPRERGWKLFFDPGEDWEPDAGDEAPFGLCGWCWRVYQARNRKAA